MESVWTSERMTKLLEYVALGWSANQIAGALGGGITRSAVLGKMNRDGIISLNARPRPILSTVGRNDGNIVRRIRTRRKANLPKPQIVPELPKQNCSQLLPDEIPIEQRKSFAELEPHHCKFPYGEVGEPGFFFCGGDALPDVPYCASHCRAAYRDVPRPSQRLSKLYDERRRLAAVIVLQAERIDPIDPDERGVAA